MNQSQSEPTGGSSVLANAEARLRRMQSTVAALEAKRVRSSKITLVIGLILCGVMVVYFQWGYAEVKTLTPEFIVATAEPYVMDNLKPARLDLEKHINESADAWALAISDRAFEEFPQLREMLEDFTIARLDQSLEELKFLTAEEFRRFCKDNRDKLEEGFTFLQKEELAATYVSELSTLAEKQLGADVRDQADETLRLLIHVNHELKALQKGVTPDGGKLTRDQLLARETLMMARQLEDVSLDDRPRTKKPANRGGIDSGTETPAGDEPKATDGDKPASKEEKSDSGDKSDSGAKKDSESTDRS